MNADTASHQRISRLTPLADVLASIARIEPVAPRVTALANAQGCVVAADLIATEALPSKPLAARDGWAVSSDATRDAGPYAPLTLQPPPERVDAFAALPGGTDAVAPLDAVTLMGGLMQITAPVAPGEGVLPATADAEANSLLCAAGTRLRASDIAILASAQISETSVRQVRLHVVNTRPDDEKLRAAADFVVRVASTAGALVKVSSDLETSLRDDASDAIIAIGGTGAGRDDRSVIALSRAGVVTCHGIGLAPGETSAIGMASGRPVLLMPGRIDAVLACWLTIGKPLVDRLTAASSRDVAAKATLTRKVTSTIGLAEVVPLRNDGVGVEPLASGYLSLQSMARSDGWMLVPAESEGYPAGTTIEMRALP